MGLSATKVESLPVRLDSAAIDESAVRLSDPIVARVIEAIRRQLPVVAAHARGRSSDARRYWKRGLRP
jgi:hypothetical protein